MPSKLTPKFLNVGTDASDNEWNRLTIIKFFQFLLMSEFWYRKTVPTYPLVSHRKYGKIFDNDRQIELSNSSKKDSRTRQRISPSAKVFEMFKGGSRTTFSQNSRARLRHLHSILIFIKNNLAQGY